MTQINKTILIAVVIILTRSSTYSFEVNTHSALSERAVQNSSVDDFLKSQLGLTVGVETNLSDGNTTRTVIRWMQEGSVREDDNIRPANHFHDPLRTWDRASPFGFSAICWAQATNCRGGSVANDFSWQQARQRYFNSLIASVQAERDQNLALTFQTLGQLIHLVQDVATPAHSRVDSHFISSDGFHVFAEDIVGTSLFDQLTGVSTGFDPAILTVPANPLAPIPIGRIIDTTDPDQVAAVPSAGTNIGMAEYSNSNFLSDGTIFSGFVFPRVESLGTSIKVKGVTYFPKIAEGELVDHFVAQDHKQNFFLSQKKGRKNVPNSLVFTDYARKLLPRAVGYSAGFIDYFFRGRMDVVISEDQTSETELRVKVRNTTPDEDTMGKTGAIVGALRYILSGQEFFSVSDLRQLTLTRDFQELVFNLVPPDGAEEAFLTVVYKGQLGLEEEAVMQGRTAVIILKPKNPTLACPNGRVVFTAVGGKLPYNWSTTRGLITPSGGNNQNAVLTPQLNVPGIAFVRIGYGAGLDCTTPSQTGIVSYNCASQPWPASVGPSCTTDWDCGSECGPGQAGLAVGTCGPLVCQDQLAQCGPPWCAGNAAVYLENNPEAGVIVDVRSQQMIDAGCGPCSLEMQGEGTVTVNDSAQPTPASASTRVTFQ